MTELPSRKCSATKQWLFKIGHFCYNNQKLRPLNQRKTITWTYNIEGWRKVKEDRWNQITRLFPPGLNGLSLIHGLEIFSPEKEKGIFPAGKMLMAMKTHEFFLHAVLDSLDGEKT